MTTPQITDDDTGTITADIPTRNVRSWVYTNREEQKMGMLLAREFTEGWFQAEKSSGIKRDLSEFEGS